MRNSTKLSHWTYTVGSAGIAIRILLVWGDCREVQGDMTREKWTVV